MHARWLTMDMCARHSGRQLAELFEMLPSKDDYPDYYEVITRPIALETIKHTIDTGGYRSIGAFRADLEQMFTNAKTYNVRGSQIYADAVALQVCR
ncbi:Bromodomain-containing protein [Syncephalis pseudoplumigaleata]|uniref:Bromodomain-containing protein n=1 Tax=Syncephalis pseudoplumigaleata TaxID=1712513 RepID=A0A4P9Z5E9_9FUNG|nr:Bromodomain-containing protein [Syncephalis pseudoplumigaleata]|eukprot:RKP27786.1 Bromodomain-containing protein [Syncephalis pseudoplumigaleata]